MARPRGKPFPKGISGCPGGVSKIEREVIAYAREHTVEAVESLRRIALDPTVDARARARASAEIVKLGCRRA